MSQRYGPDISNHCAEGPVAPIGGPQPLFVLMPLVSTNTNLLSATR